MVIVVLWSHYKALTQKITPHWKANLDKLIVAEEFTESETSIFIINVTIRHSWVWSWSAEPSFQLHYILLKIRFNIILTYVLTSVMWSVPLGVFSPEVHRSKTVDAHIRKIKTKSCAIFHLFSINSTYFSPSDYHQGPQRQLLDVSKTITCCSLDVNLL